MNYVHGQDPHLEIKSAVSILISSDFLQMEPLVSKALDYIADNLQEIILLPIDMSCMNQQLVKQLASITDICVLETLNDRKDKLRSKLYMKKLECTFEDQKQYLMRCVNCCALFTKQQRQWQVCPNGRMFIDAHGKACQ